jgi:hypothetical protein
MGWQTPPVADRADEGNGIRLAGFAFTAAGALLAGYGALSTWVTVGLENVQTKTDTVVPGTDLPDGKAVLGASIVMLLAVLAMRMLAGRRARATAAALVIAGAFVCIALGGAFLVMADGRSDVLELIVDPELLDAIDYFVDVGGGPVLVLLGGVLAFVGGTLSLAWATRPGMRPPPATGSRTPETTPPPDKHLII